MFFPYFITKLKCTAIIIKICKFSHILPFIFSFFFFYFNQICKCKQFISKKQRLWKHLFALIAKLTLFTFVHYYVCRLFKALILSKEGEREKNIYIYAKNDYFHYLLSWVVYTRWRINCDYQCSWPLFHSLIST